MERDGLAQSVAIRLNKSGCIGRTTQRRILAQRRPCEAPTCRICGSLLEPRSSTWACRRCARRFLTADAARRGRALLSVARAYLRRLPARPARGVRRPETRSSRSTRTSPPTPTRWVEHARALRRGDDRAASGSTATAWSSSSPRTTATCCSTSSRTGDPGARHRSGGERRRGGPRARRRDASSTSSARRSRDDAGRRGAAGRPDRREQRPRAGARRSTTSSPASRSCSRRTGWRRSRCRISPRLIEGLQFDTIYHEHYSYFSLTTLDRALLDARARALRRRGAALARRLAPRLPATAPGRERTRVEPSVARVLAEERAAGYDTARRVRELRRRVVAETKWRLLELLIGLRREGKRVVGYGAPGQGQHAAELLRHPDRPPRLHRRPQPVQAREVPARHAHPDPSAGAHRRDEARLRPDPAVEPEEGDRRAARLRPGMGGAADRPDSRARGPAVAVTDAAAA